MSLARWLLAVTVAVVGCVPEDEGSCEAASIDGGIFGSTLDACEDGDSCPTGLDAAVFDADPNATPGPNAPLTEVHSEGDYAVELEPGTYYVCRFLGDTAWSCSEPVTLTSKSPVVRVDYLFDSADSEWTVEDCESAP